jgi:hypothetical protein
MHDMNEASGRYEVHRRERRGVMTLSGIRPFFAARCSEAFKQERRGKQSKDL